jgi:hypothetical protein
MQPSILNPSAEGGSEETRSLLSESLKSSTVDCSRSKQNLKIYGLAFDLPFSKPTVNNEGLMQQLFYCMSNSFRHHGALVQEFGTK